MEIKTLLLLRGSCERISLQVGTHVNGVFLRILQRRRRNTAGKSFGLLKSFSAGSPITVFNCARAIARSFWARINSCFRCRYSDLCAQVIGLHGHATVKAVFASIQDCRGRLECLIAKLQLLFGQQDAVVRINHLKNDFRLRAVPVD